jgi:hypothetical protein
VGHAPGAGPERQRAGPAPSEPAAASATASRVRERARTATAAIVYAPLAAATPRGGHRGRGGRAPARRSRAHRRCMPPTRARSRGASRAIDR